MFEQLGPPDVDMSLGRPKFVFSKIGLTSVVSFRDDCIKWGRIEVSWWGHPRSAPVSLKRGLNDSDLWPQI